MSAHRPNLKGKKPKTAWKQEYNQTRRRKYAEDKEVRTKTLKRVANWQKRQAADNSGPYRELLKARLRKVQEHGAYRIDPETGETRVCFTLGEVAVLISRRTETVTNWVNDGLFPRPPQTFRGLNGQDAAVFTLGQAERLLKAAIAHFHSKSSHLSSAKPDAIAAFHSAVTTQAD